MIDDNAGAARKCTIGYRMPARGEWILREGWYWPSSPCNQGHSAPRNRFKQCVQCVREYRATKNHFSDIASAKEWRADNKVYMSRHRREYAIRNPDRRMLISARQVAKNKGLPFNLTLEDVAVPDRCPALGIALRSVRGTRLKEAPSLDRIVPHLGYTKGNVVVVSWHANRIKADATIDELRQVADFYSNLTKAK